MFSFTVAERRFPAIFLCLSLLAFSGCYKTQTAENLPPADPSVLPDATDPAFQIPPSNINLANPLVVSQRPDDVAMCAKINELIEKSPNANSRWGVFAVSLKDGRVLCERDGRKLFNPASIQKTLTAIVGLDKLGADYVWKTSVYTASEIDENGTVNGDLTLYGEGAPDFDAIALETLVNNLYAKGLRRVEGNVIGDSSYFRGDTIGDGWTWNELQWYYGAEASALSYDENQAFVNVENGSGRASTDYLNVTVGKPTPINSNSNSDANYEAGGIKRGLDNNNFYVWGNTKSFGARVAVHNPAGLAAKNFKEVLERKGIKVAGETSSRDWKAEKQLDIANSRELSYVFSASLGEIVRKMNKTSNNFYAEIILRTIGKNFSDSVPSNIQLPQNVRGDDTTGAAVIKKWLLEKNIAADEVRIADGSGLSRLDFVTPETFARAFIFAAQSNYAQVFTDSLPISATDGTLGGRLGKAKGKVLAKTGTITYVNSLAGYAQRKDGEILTFSVIVNNETRKNGAVGVIDSIVLGLIGETDENQKETANSNKNNQNANNNTNSNKPNFVIESKTQKP